MRKSILTTAAMAMLATCVQAADMASLVPEAKDFKTVYELDPSKSSAYTLDNSAQISGQIERVAYFLLLNDKDYVFVAMDPFTQDVKQIGVPASTSVFFQTNIKNMLVKFNVEGVESGSFVDGGNIEFWATNYSSKNVKSIPGAADNKYDFGDIKSDGGAYGCMQVHNYAAKQTVFAFNNLRAKQRADLGIGNRPNEGNTDWTFSKNAGKYTSAKLVVLVKTK
jgi:sialate O-acetylesterase